MHNCSSFQIHFDAFVADTINSFKSPTKFTVAVCHYVLSLSLSQCWKVNYCWEKSENIFNIENGSGTAVKHDTLWGGSTWEDSNSSSETSLSMPAMHMPMIRGWLGQGVGHDIGTLLEMPISLMKEINLRERERKKEEERKERRKEKKEGKKEKKASKKKKDKERKRK